MKFWWVNQKQTYRHEVPGGYMWSPKLNTAGQHIRPYDLMRKISPGDIVFSYADAQIKAIGVAQSHCYEFPKPLEFGKAGIYWADVGWRVDVNFREVAQPLRTMDYIESLRPFLPEKHSPLKHASGGANQSYLFDISEEFALALAQLIDRWTLDLVRGNALLEMPARDMSALNTKAWEDKIEEQIQQSPEILETERSALVNARVGQGQYRKELLKIERACRVTRVDQERHLIASHTKPWRDCSNEERLDPENGFMLTPTIDHLFDKGFLSFENNGDLIVSPIAHADSMRKMGIDPDSLPNVGGFTAGQKRYLEWHRDSLLLC
jgi:hypothetical protein